MHVSFYQHYTWFRPNHDAKLKNAGGQLESGKVWISGSAAGLEERSSGIIDGWICLIYFYELSFLMVCFV